MLYFFFNPVHLTIVKDIYERYIEIVVMKSKNIKLAITILAVAIAISFIIIIP